MAERENKRNWYIQLQTAFFDDPDYKRFRRRLPQDVQEGTAIYLKMILLALKDGETKNAEDITLSFFHDEDTFSEEIGYAINEDPAEVQAVIDTLVKCHILEEVQPDTWMIHFPDGTIGSITDSSLRSRKCREKRRALQSNTEATQEQHKSNEYNNKNNSYSQIDSNSHINLTTITKDTETENSADAVFDSAGGGPADASAAGAAPRPAPDSDLFTIEQLNEIILRDKIKMTEEDAAAFLGEMRESGWMLYGRPIEKPSITRALRGWAKYHGAAEVSDAEAPELEDVKRLAEKELVKMFPDCKDWDELDKKEVFWSDGFKDLTIEATTHPDDRKIESEWYDTDKSETYDINRACIQIWDYFDQIMQTAYKYIDKDILWDSGHLTMILKAAGKIPQKLQDWTDDMDIPDLLPLFVPYKVFTTEQRRFLYTAYNVRFPVGNVKLLNGHKG